MKLNRIFFVSLGIALAGSVLAQTSATGTISLVSQSAGLYNYDIDLHNTGTTNMQTFWFAWVPGLNFMPDAPSNISSPSNWTETVTPGGGYAIQWVTNGGLAAGNSLDGFQFSSVDSPTVLQGTVSEFGFPYPILTSFVYSGQPEQGTADEFVVQFSSAPEPASWLAFGGLGLVTIAARRRRLKAKV